MWFRKREKDIEMSGMMTEPKKKEPDLDDTDYQPFNWKRFFFAPKYIRKFVLLSIRARCAHTLFRHDGNDTDCHR